MASVHNLVLAALNEAAPTLLVADENCRDLPFGTLPKTVKVLTNRFDIAQLASSAGLNTQFSDFDFSPYCGSPPQRVVYHVSKEKAVVHHIANQAAELLLPGGELQLIGTKQQGIKTFAKTLASRLGGTGTSHKKGPNYSVTIVRGDTTGSRLEDAEYNRLRPIMELDQKPVFSKPGTFGWDKIDQGSQLLADYLEEFLGAVTGGRLLDLGCGYGLLSLQAHSAGNRAGRAFDIVATDNCAAALIACEKNFEAHQITGKVIASDGGAQIEGRYDAVLCNPPFHQGFKTDSGLTETFLKGTKALLERKGKALFVVNQFVPLESLAKPLFSTVSTIHKGESFKLVTLS